MKHITRITAAFFLCSSFALAGGEGWMTNWEQAKAKAKAENKPILIDFTGSDWCGWCIKLDKEVFAQKAFKEYAAKNLVLMDVDFPRKKEQAADLKKQNKELEKQYPLEGYPTVLLLDAEGKKLSEDIGYREGGPEAYVKHLAELLEKAAAKKPAEPAVEKKP